jgi:ankyrin repeat protein
MKIKKNVLIIINVLLIVLILSSCVLVTNNDCDSSHKLFMGIKLNNIEMINEAIEDGANLNKIKGIIQFESNPVFIALNDGRNNLAKYLIKCGANVNYINYLNTSLLMEMAYNSDVEIARLLIELGVDVNYINKERETALEYAVDGFKNEKEVNEMITLLLENGAKIRPITLKVAYLDYADEPSYRYGMIKRILEGLLKSGYKSDLDPVLEASILGKSSKVEELIKAGKLKKEYENEVLFYTAAFGNIKTMKLLEKQGIKLNTTNKRGSSLLIIASQYGQLKMVDYLLNKGIDIETINYDSETALLVAVKNNHCKVVDYLLKKGAKYIFEYNNVLCEAADSGNLEMIKLIMSYGCKFEDKDIWISFSRAVESNNEEVAKYFLQNGVNINSNYYDVFTPLISCCIQGNLLGTKFLLDQGIKVNGANGDGNPILIACEFGRTDVVKYLIKKGADVNAVSIASDGEKKGLKGKTPLVNAIRTGNMEIVKILIENGADLECINECLDNETPIIIAAYKGSRNILEYLTKKGANINYQDKNGKTPLMYAAINGWVDNVKILLKYNADVNLKSNEGKTVLDMVESSDIYNKKEIIKLLKTAGGK